MRGQFHFMPVFGGDEDEEGDDQDLIEASDYSSAFPESENSTTIPKA